MKKLFALFLALVMLVGLCACKKKCDHEWKDATCTEPKTCSKCGATEGEKTGHLMKAATCTEPKTCSVCGATEGEALGHTWKDATCTSPKYCTVCNTAEGEIPGHQWVDNGKGSKDCSVCGENDGSGTVSMSFTKYVTVDISEKKAYLNFANPSESTQDMQVQLVLDEKVLAQTDKLSPGNKLSQMALIEGVEQNLKTGSYKGMLAISFLNRDNGKRSVLNTTIEVTIKVQA